MHPVTPCLPLTHVTLWAATTPLGNPVVSTLADLVQEGRLSCKVRGSSMEPLLSAGERVVLVKQKLYWPGDVVALVSPAGYWLVHRVLGVYRWRGRLWVLTRGDAARCADAPVRATHVLGRVVAAEGRDLGLARPPWTQRLRSVLGFLIAILSPRR